MWPFNKKVKKEKTRPLIIYKIIFKNNNKRFIAFCLALNRLEAKKIILDYLVNTDKIGFKIISINQYPVNDVQKVLGIYKLQ